MSRLKQLALILGSSLLLLNPVCSALADTANLGGGVTSTTVTGIYSINSEQNSDYKVNKDTNDSITNKINKESKVVENLTSDEDLYSLDDLTVAKSYLITNDILTRDEDFSITDEGKISFNQKYSDKADDEFHLKKSELYMMLYKAKYGVINSRPVIFNTSSYRDVNGVSTRVDSIKNYKDSSGDVYNASFIEGDYYYYVAPNVYELYMTKLLDKGIVKKSEFIQDDSHSFIEDYNNLTKGKSIPLWHTKNGVAYATETTDALGSTYEYYSDGTLTSFNYDEFPDFFKTEKISTMEALSIIENFLRISEKDMTDMEANIITYKYGVNYLTNLSKSDRKTVSFLIAKGILDFEKNNAGLNYYNVISKELAYELVYRFANTDARYDFSKVTITDSDIEWFNKGYGEDNITLYRGDTAPMVKTINTTMDSSGDEDYGVIGDIDMDDDSTSGDPGWVDISKVFDFFAPVDALADSVGYKEFTVVKMFDTTYQYTYAGVAIDQLTAAQDGFISKETVKNSSDEEYYKVTFSVYASDENAAISCVDNKIQCAISENYDAKISCLTQLQEKDGKYITMIPASAIKKNFTEISIVSDKVLVNTITGAEAIIFEESGYALVGTKIIISDDIMIKDGNDDVYYNLEIISGLFTNAYLSSLDAKINASTSMFIADSQIEEKKYSVKSSGTELGSTYVAQFKYKTNTGAEKSVRMFNLTAMSRGLNTITREFTIKDNEDNDCKVTVILDFNMTIPDPSMFSDLQLSSNVKNGSLTASDVTTAFYTRPSDSEPLLQNWWDSNIGISNSLCNFMYGTSGIMYIDTGYLAPSLTILTTSNKVKDEQIQKLFKDFKMLEINGVSYNSFINNTTSMFWNTYFNEATGMKSELKTFAKDTRKYTFIKGSSVTDGEAYTNKFFITNSGTIYRSQSSDGRIKIDSNTKTIKVNTRTDKKSETLSGSNKYFTYKYKKGSETVTSKWLMRSVDSTNTYYKILPMFYDDDYIKGQPVDSDNYPGEITISQGFLGVFYTYDLGAGRSETLSYLGKFYDKYFGDLDLEHPTKFSKPSQMFSADKRQKWLLKKRGLTNQRIQRVLSNGKVCSVEEGDNGYSKLSTIESSNNMQDAYAIPVLYIPTGSITCYEKDGSLIATSGYKGNALNLGNTYFGNINQNIIDAAVYKDGDYVPLNSIDTGTKVYIGDTLFTKTDDGFTSAPVSGDTLLEGVLNENTRDGAIANYFSGTLITLGSKKYALSDYLETVGIGNACDITDAEAEAGVLCKSGDTLGVYKNGSYNNDTTTAAGYVNLSVKFQPGLYCRPIDANGSTYELVMKSNSVSSSRFDDLPFIGESLNYPDRDKVDVKLDLSFFNVSQYHDAIKAKFEKFYRGAFLNSLQGLIYMFIICIASYIAVMSWVVYGILHYNIGRNMLSMIASPGRDKSYRGIDLIKIFTFKIYSLDSDPSASRCFVVTMLSFIVISILINSMPA